MMCSLEQRGASRAKWHYCSRYNYGREKRHAKETETRKYADRNRQSGPGRTRLASTAKKNRRTPGIRRKAQRGQAGDVVSAGRRIIRSYRARAVPRPLRHGSLKRCTGEHHRSHSFHRIQFHRKPLSHVQEHRKPASQPDAVPDPVRRFPPWPSPGSWASACTPSLPSLQPWSASRCGTSSCIAR